MKNSIAQVVVGLPVDGPFDYSIVPELMDSIQVGQRVKIVFNRRVCVGYVIGLKSASDVKRLNKLETILDNAPVLDDQQLLLARALSESYGCSMGEAIESFFPKNLRKPKGIDTIAVASNKVRNVEKAPLASLVHGSLTDAVWKHLGAEINKALTNDKNVILLAPDQSQFDPIVKNIKDRLGLTVEVLDHALTPKKEFTLWNNIKSGNVRIVLGSRKAIFAPTKNLGCVVMFDEAHASYKQEQTPHYHARNVVLMRSKITGCQAVFVSSAPSVELWEYVHRKKLKIVSFIAKESATIQTIDMTNYNPQKSSIISAPLKNMIDQVISARKQIILFMNRRGFAGTTRCTQCGYTIKCKRCNLNMVYMMSTNMLACRHCNVKGKLPDVCPDCHKAYLRSMGMGVEKLAQTLRKLYPHVFVDVFDQDSKAFPDKGTIIITTQALFQKRYTHKFDLIAVMDFDAQLYHMDFQSSHRAFALLVSLQAMVREKLIVQTRLADSVALRSAVKNDYKGFYSQELALRKELEFPPYKKLITILVRGKIEANVLMNATRLYDALSQSLAEENEVLEPQPDIITKLRDQYRYVICLKADSIVHILPHVKEVIKNVRVGSNIVTINID